ncbi:hypothetical protein MMC25_003727 [Agyrium rufum]|nr:hypothetical protein [Agyrium rufum]
MEELKKKHQKELQDLQSKITQKKKNATRKTRKGVNEECDASEQELRVRQVAEASQLNGAVEDAEEVAEEVVEPTNPKSKDEPQPIEPGHDDTTVATGIAPEKEEPSLGKKPNRQKARLARRAAEQEAVVQQAEDESRNLPDLRQQELTRMAAELDKRNLKEKLIQPDGHCLYSAIADQLEQSKIDLGIPEAEAQPNYRKIRYAAADYISQHPDDFFPFLEEPLEQYVHKLRNTGEWGGHMELSALANAYGVNIHVLQGDGRMETIEPSKKIHERPIWLGYYRHSFGLGEHYNSLRQS